jgi:hypothetical protein
MPAAIHTLVYDCGDARGFLATRVFEDHFVLAADRQDTAQALLEAMPPCRQFLFHLNSTRTARWPLDRSTLVAALEHRGVAVLNARVTDISKRAVMDVVDRLSLPSVRLNGSEADDATVIVKTDANYGGRHDEPARHGAAEWLSPAHGDNPSGYAVATLGSIPPDILASAELVVQRYVANAEGRFVRVYLAPSAMVVTLARSDKPIKKMGAGVARSNYAIVPGAGLPDVVSNAAAAVTAVAREMALDFGTIDVALDEEDRPYVIDVNTTPYWGGETQEDIIAHLRRS